MIVIKQTLNTFQSEQCFNTGESYVRDCWQCMLILLPCMYVDVTVTFSPQNYTVPEGSPAEVMIVLDKPSVRNITVSVTTMDITAQCETICS